MKIAETLSGWKDLKTAGVSGVMQGHPLDHLGLHFPIYEMGVVTPLELLRPTDFKVSSCLGFSKSNHCIER